MLFMYIITWEPAQRAEVIKRRAEKGAMIPEGMKPIGEWVDLSGGRAFRLVEVDDPKVALAAAVPWVDVAKLEAVPVMEAEERMKLLPKV